MTGNQAETAWSSIFTTVRRNLSKVELFSARKSNFSMKKFPGFFGFASNPFRQKWIKESAVLFTVLTVAVGCSKKSDQGASSTTPQTNAEAPSQPAAAPANQGANQVNQQPSQANQPARQTPRATPAAPGEPDISSLNRALRSWILANRRAPRDFDDFAASAGVPIPAAPSGKKYIITSAMHIQLVNQ